MRGGSAAEASICQGPPQTDMKRGLGPALQHHAAAARTNLSARRHTGQPMNDADRLERTCRARPRAPRPPRRRLAPARSTRPTADRRARRLADRREGPGTAGRLRRPVVRERGLRTRERGAGRRRTDAPAALRHRVLPLQQRAGHPPGREAGARSRRASLQHVLPHAGRLESVDAAVRFIVQYYNAIGKPSKKHFIALERGYHGSSSTGAGLTALPVFHRGFDLPLPTQHYIPSPNPYRSRQGGRWAGHDRGLGGGLQGQGGRAGRRERGGVLLRTHPGLGRRHRAARGLAQGHARSRPRARHPVRRGRGHHRLRPHRPDVRLRRGRRGARPDDRGQGPDLGLRADGRHADVATRSTRPSPTARPRARPSATAPPTRRTRSARRWRWRCCACTKKAACWPTASAWRRIFAQGWTTLRDAPAGGRRAPPRPARRAGAGEQQGHQGAASTPRWTCRTACSPPPSATASSSAAFGDSILGFAPALTYTESDFDQLFERLKKTLDDVLAEPECAPR